MSHRHSHFRPRRGATLPLALFPLAAALTALWGCTPTVKVEPPDEPIEINMNVRIQQEVRVTVARDLEEAFQANPALFGVPPEINAPPAAERATTFEALRPPEELAPEIGRFQRPFTERDLYGEDNGQGESLGGMGGYPRRAMPRDSSGGLERDDYLGEDGLEGPAPRRSLTPDSDLDRLDLDDEPL